MDKSSKEAREHLQTETRGRRTALRKDMSVTTSQGLPFRDGWDHGMSASSSSGRLIQSLPIDRAHGRNVFHVFQEILAAEGYLAALLYLEYSLQSLTKSS